jgi:hypothetical protein
VYDFMSFNIALIFRLLLYRFVVTIATIKRLPGGSLEDKFPPQGVSAGMNRIYLLFLALLICAFSQASAQTITAASCNASDVQAAFNSITSSTTAVTIPAGTCTWTSAVSLTVPSGSTALTIAGQGSVGSTDSLGNPTAYSDNTVVVDNMAGSSQLLTITTASSCTLFRLTGITFKGGTGGVKDPTIGIRGNCHSVRVDHNHALMSTYSNGGGSQQFRFTGWLYGVFDHNLCDDNLGISECWDIWHDGYNGGSYGDGSWAAATNLGSSNFMFFENNTVNQGWYAQDCMSGGRGVVRYNTFNQAQLQTHPLAGGNRQRGCRAQEVYKNVMNGGSSCNGSSGFNNCDFNGYWLSGGTGVFWGNSIPVVNSSAGSGYQWLITAHSMRVNNNTYGQTATPNGWGYCGTQSGLAGDGSKWDGNQNATTGYPCMDDPGRGVESSGPVNSQAWPNALNSATGTIASTQQALEPFYEWLDGVNGLYTPVPNNPGGPLSIQDGVLTQNVDIYTWTSNFTGASGVGSGALASRPSTCTTNVTYWATDQNQLYKCTSANAWSLYYTPYVYPHPLDSSTAPQTPAPPTQNPPAVTPK